LFTKRDKSREARMDRMASMAVFTKVVGTGSFSAAAREMKLSQASVTKQIQELEGWLGARLLNRTTRRLSLTEAGDGFYERCMRILDAVEEARSAAGALQTVPRGRLRINAPVSFGLLHLAPVVTEFLKLYPEVSVEMLVNDRVVDLLEGKFDVGVRIGRLRDSSLIARRIAPIRLAVCAAPEYLARHGVPRTPDDLASHNCLEYTYFESRGEWRLLDPAGKEIVVPVSGQYLANNADVLRCTAIAGGGIILVPTFLVGEDLRSGRLTRLLPDYPPPEQALYALYPPGRHLSAKVRSFVDCLVAHFGGVPAWDRC
jgi:DNA-binding transcriptional LysR family regulator